MTTRVLRKLSIDTLRGLACILLVAFHVVGDTSTVGLRLDDNDLLSRLNDVLALLRMPLFSFLSGFVYAWRPYNGEPLKFIRGKARRLLIPMLLVGTLFAVLQANTPGANAGQYDWRLLHIVPVAHYWFLESLFIIFLLTACLDRFKLLATVKPFVVIWLLAATLLLLNPLPPYLGLQGAAYLMPFFLLGLASNRFADQLPRQPVMLLTAGLFVGTCLYLIFVAAALPYKASLPGLLIGTCCCVFLLRCNLELRWLAWIGVHSFAIYLFHSMFSAASRIALLRLDVDATAYLFVAGLAAGLFGPIAAAKVLRKIPHFGHWMLGESPKAARPPRLAQA